MRTSGRSVVCELIILVSQDAFVHPQLILDQVDALEHVILDSMLLREDGSDTDKVSTRRF